MALFFRFRQCMGVYVFTDLLITFVTTLLLDHGLWIQQASHETVDVLLFWGILFAVKPVQM